MREDFGADIVPTERRALKDDEGVFARPSRAQVAAGIVGLRPARIVRGIVDAVDLGRLHGPPGGKREIRVAARLEQHFELVVDAAPAVIAAHSTAVVERPCAVNDGVPRLDPTVGPHPGPLKSSSAARINSRSCGPDSTSSNTLWRARPAAYPRPW